MTTERKLLMIVEDNEADVFLVRLALTRAGVDCEIESYSDGAEAQSRLMEAGEGGQACPDLVLLDFNLPKIGGDRLLETFRKNRSCKATPVIVMTSSDSPGDRERARDMGAVFFRKPTSLREFMEIGSLVKGFLSPGGG
jgi:CheY-like chemotaxis protein